MLSRFQIGNRKVAVWATVFLILGLAATTARIVLRYQEPGPFQPTKQGLCDFHNGMYFPFQALIKGISPYGAEYAATYPVARSIPFYSPSILVLHAPINLLPLRVAEYLYMILSYGLVIAIGWFVASLLDKPTRWDRILLISAALVFSRGGHITLLNGYFTLELVLATLVAIHYGNRNPWIAAIALAIVATKPTYILPLGFLMLARGNYKSLILGAIISVFATVTPLLWLAHHEGGGDLGAGIQELVAQIQRTQEIHRGELDESPVFSWTRIDLLAVIAKWTQQDPGDALHLIVMIVLLLPGMFVLWIRQRRGIDDGLVGITGCVILLSMLICVYHQFYDALVLLPSIAGAILAREGWRNVSPVKRWATVAMMSVPLVNYATTRSVLHLIDHIPLAHIGLTSLNAVVLAIAAGLVIQQGMREMGLKNPV
jgi:Glycosyltransferase family 87